MEKELDYMPQVSNRIKKHEIVKREKKRILSSIKIIGLSMGLVLSSYGLKSGINKISESKKIELAYESVLEAARNIENNNSYRVLKNGVRSLEYDHLGIASDIMDMGKTNGEVFKEALIGSILDSLEDNAYKNDDKVIRLLDDAKEMGVTTYEDYLHKLGYENEKDYLEATKKDLYEEMEKNKIKEKYQEEENMNRGL